MNNRYTKRIQRTNIAKNNIESPKKFDFFNERRKF